MSNSTHSVPAVMPQMESMTMVRLGKSFKGLHRKLSAALALLVLLFSAVQSYAQNSFNSGDGWGAGWGTGASFSASAGSSLIYTTTNSLGGNVNRYFRLYGNGTPCGEYGPSGAVDVLLSAETAYTSSTITCGTVKAFYVVVPNTTDNWVFKSNGVSSQQLVIFRVQGAVRTVTAVSQSPSSNVRPGQSVTVSATLSGAQSTGQNYYLRYSTDNFTTSTVVAMTVSSTTATATIPGFAETTGLKYYVFTSGTTLPTHSTADFRTINLNNNSGSNYSYTVAAPAQYTWNQTGTAAYGTSTNWTPNRTTAVVSDILIFNNGATTTVTGVPTESIGSLQVSANTTVNLQPTTTNTLTINDYVSGSDLTVASGSKLTLAGSLTLTLPTGAAGTINGTLTNAGVVTTNSNLTFSSTGVYEHNYLTGVGIIPTATWSTGSTCSIIGYTSGGMTVGASNGFGQTFSNFTYNCPNQTSAMQMTGYLTTITGTFNIVNTGIGINNLRLSQSSVNYTANYGSMIVSDTMVLAGSGTTGNAGTTVGVVNISGDLTLNNSGLIEFNSLANAVSVTVNLSGNLSMSGTTGIRRTQTATSTFNFIKTSGTQTISIASGCNITGPITFNIGNGTSTTNTLQLLSNFTFASNTNSVNVLSGSTLDLQGFVISGASSSFTTNSGSTLRIGHANGITATAASGGIQVGTRTYNAGANYLYTGTANQSTGDGLPASLTGSLTIANTGTSPTNVVTLSQATSTSGTLSLTNGGLDLNGLTLTLSSNAAAQSIAGGGSNSFTISGAANSKIALSNSSSTTSRTVTVSGFGTSSGSGLVTGSNVAIELNARTLLDCGGNGSSTSMLTIGGTFTLNSGTSSNIANTKPPFYASGSTLNYAVSYNRFDEWRATSGPGYPHHVTLSGTATLNVVNGANSYKKAGGDLTVGSGCTFSVPDLTTGSSGVGVEFVGNIINNGSISLNTGSNTTSQRIKAVNLTNGSSNTTAIVNLSGAIGGDMELTGNYTDNATFNANQRAVFFTGAGTQDISGTASAPFNIDYIVVTKGTGSVRMLVDLLTGAPNGGNGLTLTNASDIFDLNGKTFTLGTAATACGFSGNGLIRGSSASGMIINGTGALGTLNFESGNRTLGTLTVNRTSTNAGITLGTDLAIATTLTLTSGVISTGSNNLIVNSGASVSRTSGHVNGNLQKTAANGANNFEIGSASVYAPATATMSGVSGSVILTAKATSGNPTSGSSINQSKKSNHYWTITKTGAGTFTGYDAKFDFTNTTNTGTTSAYKVNKFDAGTWTNTSSTVTGTTITATGLTSFSDFEVGELLTPSVTSSAATSITTSGATLNGSVNANGFSSTVTFNYGTTTSYGSAATAAQSPVTGTSNTAVSAAISSLSVNTQYNFNVSATNTYGTSSGSNLTFYTLANAPGTPTVNNATNSTIDVLPDANGNPSITQFAIQETSTGNYVQANGSLGASAVWQTASVWGTETVTGLTAGTTYTFRVKARNGDNTETAFSSTASATTTNPLPPTITSPTATNISANTADLGGDVTSDGGVAITARGVVWSLTSLNNDPLIGGSNVTNVTGTGTTGAFTVGVTGLTAISQISYKAYATNSEGTVYTSVSTFTTTATEPSTQATAVVFSSITTSTLSLSWTNGNGGRRAVFMKAGSGAITNPADGSAYSASSNWASPGSQLGSSGYYCIYDGTDNSVSLTNLASGTEYYVQVFEYNADGSTTASSINYNTSTATGNPGNTATLSLEPQSHAASFTAAVASSASINLSFSAASSVTNASGYIILQTTGSSAPSGAPADATGYSVGNTIGDGTVAAIITNTASTSQTISGLSASTQYSFALIPFGYNGSAAATYNYYVGGTVPTASATTYAGTPSSQPTAFSATSVTCDGMTVSWTAASGSPAGYIVLRSAGATAPNTNPVTGTSYAQGATLGNATVAYVGSAVSFANSSLSDNTTYQFRIYSYNGTGATTAYNTTSPLSGSQLTSSVSAPTATAASNLASTSFTANWNAATCATAYSLYVSSTVADTVAAWTFPYTGTNTYSDSIVCAGTPNYGNGNFSLSSGTQVDYNGVTTRAAGATTWNSIGKFYQVIVNTTGYSSLTVSSAQQSSASGPRDFQLEYKIGAGGTWTAVTGGAIVCGNGSYNFLSNVALPSACNNQSQLYLRWVTTSLLRVDQTTPGSTTASGGTNRIDDIYIKGNLVSAVSGFNPATVSGTSASVTGLSPLTSYSYYLTSTAANSTSAASNTISTTTYADPTISDFRTKASGNLSDASIWQYKFDGTNWGDAPQAPSPGGNITVQSSDSIYLTSDISMNAGKVFTVNGKIDVNTRVISGAGSFVLSAGATIYTGNAAGLTGTLTIASNSRNAAANYVFNGTVAQTFGNVPATVTGNVIIDNAAGVTLVSNKTLNSPGTLTVKSGSILNFGTGSTNSAYVFDGTGNFYVQAGATLSITNSAGIVNDGASGSIRLTGTRFFDNSVNYCFTKSDGLNASAAGSSFGTEITSISDLTINNALGFIMPSNTNLTVSGNLILTSGALDINGNTLTLNGTVSGTGTIKGSATSSLVLGGTAGTLNFTQTGTGNVLKNLTLNDGATATLGNALDITPGTSVNNEGVVTVNGSATLTTGGNLTLKSNATGTARVAAGRTSGGYITGSVSVERFIPQNSTKSWRLLAANTQGQSINAAWQEEVSGVNLNPNPGYGIMVTGQAVDSADAISKGFDKKTPGYSILRYMPEVDALWGVVNTLTTNVNDYSGYFVFIRGDRANGGSFGAGAPNSSTTLRSKGSLFTGNQSPITIPSGQFALIGNPYPSRIDLRNVTVGSGIVNAFQVWDPKMSGTAGLGAYQALTWNGSNYIVTPGGGSYGSSGSVQNFIESGSAFFMESASNSNNTVTFTESCKTSGSSVVNRPTIPVSVNPSLVTNLYAINSATSTELADGNRIDYDASYNNGKDVLDVKKNYNFADNFGLFSNNLDLIVERRALPTEADTVFYSMSGLKRIGYRLDFTATDLGATGLSAVLEDTYLNTATPVSLEGTTSYTFTVDANAGSSAARRFRIVFRPQAPLPVTLRSVRAWQQQSDIKVEWTVANQLNIQRYVVEKSVDGRSFSAVGNVTATGNNRAEITYNWLDAQPVQGANYYRIRSIGNDGAFSISSVVWVVIGKSAPAVSVWPNPVEGRQMNLNFVNMQAGAYQVRLLNALGQITSVNKISHSGGSAVQIIALPSRLVAGIYNLEVISPDNSRHLQKVNLK